MHPYATFNDNHTIYRAIHPTNFILAANFQGFSIHIPSVGLLSARTSLGDTVVVILLCFSTLKGPAGLYGKWRITLCELDTRMQKLGLLWEERELELLTLQKLQLRLTQTPKLL